MIKATNEMFIGSYNQQRFDIALFSNRINCALIRLKEWHINLNRIIINIYYNTNENQNSIIVFKSNKNKYYDSIISKISCALLIRRKYSLSRSKGNCAIIIRIEIINQKSPLEYIRTIQNVADGCKRQEDLLNENYIN